MFKKYPVLHREQLVELVHYAHPVKQLAHPAVSDTKYYEAGHEGHVIEVELITHEGQAWGHATHEPLLSL